MSFVFNSFGYKNNNTNTNTANNIPMNEIKLKKIQ